MAMKSWLSIPKGSGFSLANIPFGIISTKADPAHRPAVAIGDQALDIATFASRGGFQSLQEFPKDRLDVFSQQSLNAFASLGRPVHRAVRNYLRDVFRDDTPYPEILKENQALRDSALKPLSDVEMHLPMEIGDYTDFFAGRNHAQNVGTLFRGPANALNPNYNHLPVAYHGRASSVVVSGTPLHRPCGQVLPAPTAKEPAYQPCAKLDIELELGMFLCRGNALGQPITVDEAEDYIFGFVLMNDWSARDLQTWEYIPLGPFTAKNFGTTISPWVVLADALEPFKGPGLSNDVKLLPYLRESRGDNVIALDLQVDLRTSKGSTTTLSRTSSKNLLWSWPQMIAHHTVAGCNMRTGDLFGSGTVSGSEAGTYGSLLEQCQGGKVPIVLEGGEERKFLQDGDTIVIKGCATAPDGQVVGFGDCVGQVLEPLSRQAS
ncbi:hypothetical protein L249_1099 [Ophiocordyceps polyrhachis-furcata BCC 54312]|uniref:Fumarylacetoacetase n=1 Tax=Ophiocordyceps polyrhachis-furcata BCC 54312 TaxID=1330021 RepID=A0A367LCH8_9HYPO|nr:hypothetical protein L249_1099 [Ophiocordyceps polyrhachis-furcata BCC 54312]